MDTDLEAPWLDEVTLGVELELLAPAGSSRRHVAQALAEAFEGRVVPVFHPDSEPALVPGTPVFENLTLGFEVLDASGARIARVVDDLTLQADLDRHAPPRPAWFRVVSDDRRLLHLVRQHGRADAGPIEALAPVAALFGTELQLQDGIAKVVDPDGAPVALGSYLPGERERPCELVTAPIPRPALRETLHALLGAVLPLGLRVAAEAATHIHVDRRPFESAATVRRLVRLWERHGTSIKAQVGTNARCRRLGSWSPALRELVEQPGFVELPWAQAKARVAQLGLSKFVDLNLKGLVHNIPGKPTIEARFFPGTADPDQVADWAEAWLDRLEIVV